MDAKSLMIGDWVLCNGKMGRITDIVSCRGYVGKYEYCFGIDYTANVSGDKKYAPIPITAEILKANGFVDGVLPYSLCNTELQLSMQDNNGFWAFGINTEHTEFCDLAMNYVHELQHALRLCGLNELADNFKVMEE